MSQTDPRHVSLPMKLSFTTVIRIYECAFEKFGHHSLSLSSFDLDFVLFCCFCCKILDS